MLRLKWIFITTLTLSILTTTTAQAEWYQWSKWLEWFGNKTNHQTSDPLPSWNSGPIKKNIIAFVQQVTDKTNPNYVTPEERIATIDNDGTLWVEQPVYTQAIFAFDRVKTLAKEHHPEWKKQTPFSAIIKNDENAIARFKKEDFAKIVIATHANISTEEFQKAVQDWFATAINPRYKKHYNELVYQPMLEVIHFLKQNDFQVYIVSGGSQDFIRAYADKIYGIPNQHIIGSATVTEYTYRNNQPILMKTPKILLVSDGAGKPEALNLFINKKPIIAFGNSDSDEQMLEWTQSNPKKHLMLLVHHDDAKREYAYGPEAKVGRFSDNLMTKALKNNWQVISMQKDWKVIFPFQK